MSSPMPWYIELGFGLLGLSVLIAGYWALFSQCIDKEAPLFKGRALHQNNDRTFSDLNEVDGFSDSTIDKG